MQLRTRDHARRRASRRVSAAAAVLGALVGAPCALAANPVQIENAKPGDSYWTAATQDGLTAKPPIEGYASATSVRPGQTISFFVNTSPAGRYRVEIDRLGWYGGSGGRRIMCVVGSKLDASCAADRVGVRQPAAPSPDPVTGQIAAAWTSTDTLAVPPGWVSGYYLAVFRLTSGPAAGQTGFTPFIVQAPAGDHAAILVQVPTNTWQAYNPWGGRDLYTTPQAVKVSFDRPYAHRLLFNWEYPLVRFLERGGWDVSYATDDNVDSDPSILMHHALDMSAGHDEYWTKAMRDGWEAARDAGVNLAFMGANDGFWQVRYENNQRTMVGYKYLPDPSPDPATKTTQFRWLQPPRPECQLEGVQFNGTILYRQYLDYTVDSAAANDPWLAGTGLGIGSVLPGLVGYETDAITPSCHVPPPLPLLSYYSPPSAPGGIPAQADSARYIACSGAEVFAAGSLQFPWGLDSWRDPAYSAPGLPPAPPDSPGLQQAMTRALADLIQSHVPVPSPPHICIPEPSFTPSVERPAVGQPVLFSSTAADPYGQIQSQGWEFTGSTDFEDASGNTALQSFQTPGVYDVTLRVTDSSGAFSTITTPIAVCLCPPGGSGYYPPPVRPRAIPCQAANFGSLTRGRGLLRFVMPAGMRGFTIGESSLSLGAGGAVRATLLTRFTGSATAVLRTGNRRWPLLIDVTARLADTALHEQFLVASGRGARLVPTSPQGATGCDGTAARVLTPVFGGAGSSPLRFALAGTGRAIVTLSRGSGAPLYRRAVRLRARRTLVSVRAGALAPGRYEIRISTGTAKSSSTVALFALRI